MWAPGQERPCGGGGGGESQPAMDEPPEKEPVSLVTCPSFAELWGLSQIREREIFSQQLRPSDSGQGGRSRTVDRELQLPGSTRAVNQQKSQPAASGTPSAPSWVHSLSLSHPPPLRPFVQAMNPCPTGLRFRENASLFHPIPKGSLSDPWLPCQASKLLPEDLPPPSLTSFLWTWSCLDPSSKGNNIVFS